MDFKTHINTTVKVQLTKYGVSVLRNRYNKLNEELKARRGVDLGEFHLKLDEQGYYSTQLWILIRDFGSVVGLARKPVFFGDIIIKDGKPLTREFYADGELFSVDE